MDVFFFPHSVEHTHKHRAVYSDPLMQIYDSDVMFHRAMLVHDLVSGTFIASQLDNERKQPALVFSQKGRYADFQTSAIRRRGIK